MTRPVDDKCAHCGQVATGNAIARVGNKNVRLCATPKFPFESSCVDLVKVTGHDLADECWITMRFVRSMPHESWCILSDSRQKDLSEEMRELIPQVCHRECFGKHVALVTLMRANDPWLTAVQPPIEVIAEKVKDLTHGQGRPSAARLVEAGRAKPRSPEPGPRALTATRTALVAAPLSTSSDEST